MLPTSREIAFDVAGTRPSRRWRDLYRAAGRFFQISQSLLYPGGDPMRRLLALHSLLALILFTFGCGHEETTAPTENPSDVRAAEDVVKARDNAPPRYYSTYWTAVGMSMETIDTVHGAGVPFLDDVFLDDPAGKGYAAALGLTFDLDGTVYILNNWLLGTNPYLAELTKIDLNTGATTVVAEIDNHFCGSEIDACGNLYTVGFEPPPPNYGYYFSPLYGDKLCRIDKYTGEVTPIGDGTGLPDIMDLAFDSHGTLWATTQNKLYTIDLDDGIANWVADITNVPPAPEGESNPMMIMSIAFDNNDILYGTAIVGFCVVCNNISPIMRIDTETGAGTVLGYSELGYNHGGDTMPTTVRVAHRLGNGGYSCITVSLNALPAHLAHGDYVPGTNGHDCDCP
jgi:hypothetical protein